MKEKLKQLTKETFIYGISTILGRFLNFILVPFYTNIFLPEEYGIVTNVYAIVAILNVIFLYGLDSAYMKFATSDEFGNKKLVFSIPTIALIITSVIISLAIYLLQNPLMGFLSLSESYKYIIIYTLFILLFDTFSAIPFLCMRLENQAVRFTVIKVSNIVINVLLNIILIVGLGWGIEGVFISNLVASFFSLVLVLPVYYKLFAFTFDGRLFKRFIKFGIPYLPAGLASIFIQVIDRPIVEHLTDLTRLGIYQANYRLGIFMMLFVSMFQFAWQPFFLKNAKEPNAKELYSKVFTYFTLVGSFILIFLTLFIEDIVKIKIFGRHLIGYAYWGGLNIVPVVLLAYLFNGFHIIFSAGLYIKEKSNSVPIIMGISAAVNIGANFALIPFLGIYGAGLATLASYIVMALGYFIVSQRLFYIKYEFKKVTLVFVCLFLIGSSYFYIIPYEMIDLCVKFALLALFIVLLMVLRVIEAREIRGIKLLFQKK
ncbi:MAG: lipopolysaccharide biosynthesis protein [Ignavibacteriaceae bacterium]